MLLGEFELSTNAETGRESNRCRPERDIFHVGCDRVQQYGGQRRREVLQQEEACGSLSGLNSAGPATTKRANLTRAHQSPEPSTTCQHLEKERNLTKRNKNSVTHIPKAALRRFGTHFGTEEAAPNQADTSP